MNLKKPWKLKESREKNVLMSTELSKKECKSSVQFRSRLLESKEKSKLKLQLWRSNSEWLKSKNRWKWTDTREKLDLPNTDLSKTESEMKERPLFSFTKSNKKMSTIEDKPILSSLVLSMVRDSSKKDMKEISDFQCQETNKWDLLLQRSSELQMLLPLLLL